ncbi:class I adenylate-forming enzyme family protein [Streptomyces sp. NL15-2K]|uniref:class I adenylate-forming enzyme family protein n=1 Tax=Streptomyces sp. NL15-2K TaxID=376149 RepID=UPI000F571A2F|nr:MULTISPECIES: AMP-binding protein [Actinomycetes]WKX11328.1 AMP-binding protein [Kutzneria buriramensis]GCB47264.1 non-ribosomal peptide synthetase [Streptomyces sp. NL15-2K]
MSHVTDHLLVGARDADNVTLGAAEHAAVVDILTSTSKDGAVVARVGSGFVPSLASAARSLGRALWFVPRDETDETLARVAEATGAETSLVETTRADADGTAEVAGHHLRVTGHRSRTAAPAPIAGIGMITSGSTGEPRYVLRDWDSLLLEASTVASALRLPGPRASIICAAPLSHAYGFVMGYLGALVTGSRLLVIPQTMTGHRIAHLATQWSAEALVAVPAQYARMRRDAGEPLPEKVLRVCVSAGSDLTPTVRAAFSRSFGRVIVNHYGTTTSGSIARTDGEQPPDCVGVPYPGVKVTKGADGEIIVASPWSAADDAGERTGDLGHFEEEQLHLDGRLADQVNIHGRKTTRARIESVIVSCPGVSDAAVDVVRTEDGDGWVVAYVAAESEDVVTAVTAGCRRDLPAFAQPKRIVVVPGIPRTERGKLRRDRLPPLT